MSAELIYKTTSPAAIEWWRNLTAKRDEQHLLRRAFVEEMQALYGIPDRRFYDGQTPRRELYVQGEYAVGLDSGYDERPPAGSGWRLDSKDRFWKPALATAPGKALKVRLAGLTTYSVRSHMPEIGVAQIAFAGMHMYNAGMDFDETPEPTLYQIWGSGKCAAECEAAMAKVPEVVWVEVKRSEWYAREEAKTVTS